MSWEKLETWPEYDLGQSLWPSFTLAFYEVRRGAYVVMHGRFRGARLRQERKGELLYSGLGEHEAAVLSGAWFNPHEKASRLPRSSRGRIQLLLEALPGLGLAVDPWNPVGVAFTAFLSQNTSFHKRVLVWFRRLSEKAGFSDDKLWVPDPSLVSGSYQLYRLSRARRSLAEKAAEISGRDVWTARRKLLSVEGVGPKIAHSILLFTGKSTLLPPVDRHFSALAGKLGVSGRSPDKRLCSKYSCRRCPLRESCLVWRAAREYGDLAGWVQTAAYYLGASRRGLPV